MGVRDPVGGPGPPAVLVLSAFFSRTRGDTGPVPSGKRVRCRWSGEMEPDPWGPAALYGVATDNYTSLDMARGGTPVLRYRHYIYDFVSSLILDKNHLDYSKIIYG